MDITEKIIALEQDVTDERGRLSSDRMDISFGEIISLYKSKELLIRPEYQRLYRWSPEQKTALIESILLSIPIPPIFVAEDSEGIWELIDGLQRVATIITFFGELVSDITSIEYQIDDDFDNPDGEKLKLSNNWILDAGSLIPSLEGFTYETLPTKLKINIKRAVCRVEILRGGSSSSMKYELFKRLNSGGSKLKPQEIRNAVYRGIGTHVNELIFKLCSNLDFQELTALSDQKKLELYDQELVLRFVAFYNNVENINENTENFLNAFMVKASSNKSFDSELYINLFSHALSMIRLLNDKFIFRNDKNTFVPAYFEGIMIGLSQNIDKYDANQALLKARIEELKNHSDFKKYSGSGSSSKSRNKNRLNVAITIFGR